MTRLIILDPVQVLDILPPHDPTPPHTPSELDQTEEEQSYYNGTPTESYNDLNLPTIRYTPSQLERESSQETYLSSEPSETPQQFYSNIAEQNRNRPPATPVNQRIPEPHTPPPIRRRLTPFPSLSLGSPFRQATPTPGPSRIRRFGRRLRRSLTTPIRQPGSSNTHLDSTHPT